LYLEFLPRFWRQWDDDIKRFLDNDAGLRRMPGSRDTSWYEVLYCYTSSDLTKPKDKLLALAGLASEIHLANGHDYLAGLWRDRLVHGLLWHVVESFENVSRPRQYRAPTWLWASPGGLVNIQIPKGIANPLCTIIEASVQPLSSNIFSQVGSGFIRLRGKLNLLRFVGTYGELQWTEWALKMNEMESWAHPFKSVAYNWDANPTLYFDGS
jgi:hypothetical protein